MGSAHLLPVKLHAESRRVWHGNAAVNNLQRIFGQARVALLPDPVGIDGGGVARRGGADLVNIAREISKWLLEWQPQVSPQSSHSCATRTAPESVQKCGSASGISTALSITAWPISRQLVAIILVATGGPVARRNSAITSRPEKPLLGAARIFGVGQNILQPLYTARWPHPAARRR